MGACLGAQKSDVVHVSTETKDKGRAKIIDVSGNPTLTFTLPILIIL